MPLPPLVGNGRYRTLRLLGEGARKRVYLATDERLGREVAVAVVKTDGLDAGGRIRIRREAQAMARLGDDPHIVTVFDVGEEDDGTPFIVSQFMQGGSLADHLAAAPDGRMPVDRALELAESIAAGLAHAHRQGIVHRDLKPANVWLGGEGRARLGDFGLAANLGASRITVEGTLLGTVAYLAPEQALGHDPDLRSDLYAFGALVYELLCGRPPFLGDDAVSVIGQHLHTVPVAPRFHREEIPLDVEALVLRLLAKDPAARPQSADEVVDAISRVRVAAAEGSREAPSATPTRSAIAALADWGRFVGRTDELQALKSAFDDVVSGRSRAVMVVGEPGVGKTRMVEEFSVYASLRGARVLWGHSYEGEIGVSFLPYVEALRTMVRDGDGLPTDASAGGAELATIVPELRERMPHLPVLPPLAGDADRLRLFEGISAFLEAATRLRPTVLVLDDLHWADKPSLLLLAHLCRRVRTSRLLIVGTYRDVELDRSHPLAETISVLRRERLYERVLLRGLPPDEVKDLIEAVGGQATPTAFAELIFRETEGNPFFVAEILRHLVETGALRHEGGAWVGTPESVAENLPEGVREVIGRRLDGLSDGCNAALAVAAAMPGGFTIDVVGDVAGIDEDTMLDYLDEALAAQVVRERRERPGTYEFNHALIRQTLYGELSTPRKVRMHRRVAEALERRFGDSIESHLSELAYHTFQAAPGGDVAKAVDYAR
ncbi:MAG TPA: AAA family ATPase, partial [Acidimicrobiales bacterium]